MTHFRTAVEIQRSPAEVFEVVSDPTTYPRWNSAVESVEPLDGGRYEMSRSLPTGRAKNLLELVDAKPAEEVIVRASEGPTPFTYRYRLSSANGGTRLELDAEVELDGVFRLAGPLAQRVVRSGVDENMRTLKRMMEDG